MSTFVTGDTHGDHDIGKLTIKKWPQQRELTKSDNLIVCGDWGGVWVNVYTRKENYRLNWYNNKSFTTLIVNGNHDNIPRLLTFPEVPMFGDVVRQVSDSIFYLQNGHIYTIEGETYFVMGGATSIDKQYRIEGISWWKEEIPDYATFQLGFDTLAKAGKKVDYILSHAIHSTGMAELSVDKLKYCIFEDKFIDPMLKPLEMIRESVQYKKWFCGHYHVDMWFEATKTRILYQDVIDVHHEELSFRIEKPTQEEKKE